MLPSVFLKASEATNVVFVYILVECHSEGDISFDASNPLVDATFNLARTFVSKQTNDKHQKDSQLSKLERGLEWWRDWSKNCMSCLCLVCFWTTWHWWLSGWALTDRVPCAPLIQHGLSTIQSDTCSTQQEWYLVNKHVAIFQFLSYVSGDSWQWSCDCGHFQNHRRSQLKARSSSWALLEDVIHD